MGMQPNVPKVARDAVQLHRSLVATLAHVFLGHGRASGMLEVR